MSVPARTLSPVAPAPRTTPAPARPPDPPRRSTPARARTAPRRRRSPLGFVVLASVVVGSMVLGLVSLNVLLAQVSFRIDAAERRVSDLAREQVDLVRRQATLSAPGRIAGWAARNGMRLPDDIRSLHEPSGTPSTPAGAAASGNGR